MQRLSFRFWLNKSQTASLFIQQFHLLQQQVTGRRRVFAESIRQESAPSTRQSCCSGMGQ